MQEKLNKIKDYYNVKYTEDWSDDLDWYIYSESTADGYEVYVSHDNKTPISIEDNVYYYENDLSDELGNQTADDNISKIYVYDMDEYWFEQGINDIVEYIDDQLEEDE
jgi:hypothetical protein